MTPTTYDLVVSRADGSGQRVIAIDPKLTMDDMVQFTPDGRSLLVSTKGGQVDRYDVAGTTPPVAIGHGRFMIGEVRDRRTAPSSCSSPTAPPRSTCRDS